MSSSTSGEGSHLTVLVKEDEEDVNPFADPSLTAANVYDVVPRGAPVETRPRQREEEEKPRDPYAPPGNLSGLFSFGGGNVAAFSSHVHLEDETGVLGEGTIDDEVLDSKRRELDKKEAELRIREDAYDEISATIERRPNWPSCRPVLYHDIRAEIAEENRAMVQTAYMTWLGTAFGYTLNAVVMTLIFWSGLGAGIGDWFFACLFAVAGVPISFQTWYRVLYNAGKRRQSGMFTSAIYIRFFMHFGFHLAMVVWMLASIPVVGSMCAGIITTMLVFSKEDGSWGEFVGFLSFLNVLVWGMIGFASLYVGGAALTRFRTGGGPADVRRGVRFSGALIH